MTARRPRASSGGSSDDGCSGGSSGGSSGGGNHHSNWKGVAVAAAVSHVKASTATAAPFLPTAAATTTTAPKHHHYPHHLNHNHHHHHKCMRLPRQLTTGAFCILLFSVSVFQIYLSAHSTMRLTTTTLPPLSGGLVFSQPNYGSGAAPAVADSRDLYRPLQSAGQEPRTDNTASWSKPVTSKPRASKRATATSGVESSQKRNQRGLPLDVVPVQYPRVVLLGSQQQQQHQPINPSAPPHTRFVEAMSERPELLLNETRYDFTLSPWEEQLAKDCVPMADWQTHSFVTCNVLHELDMELDRLALISMGGSWRSVWQYPDSNNNNNNINETTTIALKLLKHVEHEFDAIAYEHHRIDALVMERLTYSSHIVNAFGFCGQSVLTEFATGLARDLVKNVDLHSLERLELGRDLAQALTDVHSMDYPNATNATFAHNDMNMANAVDVNGRIKLNDFNIGVLLQWNRTSGNSTCQTPVRYSMPLWKSPEENRPRYHSSSPNLVDAPPTDVYGLGNLLFHMLTKRQPWTHLEPDGRLMDDNLTEAKLAGQLPALPLKYSGDPSLNTTDNKPSYQALYYAAMACFSLDPDDRPTSYELAWRLDKAVALVKRQQGHRYDAKKTRDILRSLIVDGIV